ncbi:MAG: molybdopterin-dependent oxidoreductase [Alphaproteobacteria bacterium]|nr:molybdopterin-dependent oxidoreductase [Alphaproteobacteria bacterium]
MSKRYTAAHWGAFEVRGYGDDLRLNPVADDPHPSRIGAGWVSAIQDTKARIHGPVVRRGWLKDRDKNRCAGDRFVPVSWETALDLVSGELERVRTHHGNSAIFAGSYGWASAGRFHHAQSHLRRFLNTIGGFTRSVNTYSHGAAEVLLPHVTGMSHRQFQDQITSWPLIAENCELLVAFGGVSARTAQLTSSGTTGHEVPGWVNRAFSNGMTMALISPQRGDAADHDAVEWFPIRPGTDMALMLAIAYELVRIEAVDLAFLERYTVGWDALKDHISGASDGIAKTPRWAAEICDVDTDAIVELASRMARSRTMITVSWSLQRAEHGEQPLWMGLALAAMLGQIGRPGTGFGFGYGSMTAIGRPAKLIGWPSVPQGPNAVPDFIPVARIADLLERPGEVFHYNGEQHRFPDTRLVYWVGGNPFHHHQDLNRLEQAWQRPEAVIVHEHSWTATAARADIVLPATSPLERNDIMINRRDPSLIWMSRAMDPLGESRNDYDIFAELADRLGTGQAFTDGRSSAQWLAWLWESCVRVADENGIELPSFESFQELGRFDCPNTSETRIQFRDFVADPDRHALGTVSGKIELSSSAIADMDLDGMASHPHWKRSGETVTDAPSGALFLISPQPDTRLHAQLDNGNESRRAKIDGREPCYMHPDTATARGIGAGDIVLIENARGACLAGAVLTEDIRLDTIALATGALLDLHWIDGRRIDINGNPNVLTRDEGCSHLSQGNMAHTAIVFLSRFRGDAPQATTFHAPSMVADPSLR